jgi:hypothetical protein
VTDDTYRSSTQLKEGTYIASFQITTVKADRKIVAKQLSKTRRRSKNTLKYVARSRQVYIELVVEALPITFSI